MGEITYDISGVSREPLSLPVPRATVSGAPPVLSGEALIGLAGDVVEMIEPFTESATSALLADFLVSFGSAVGRGPCMYADGALHELKLFVVVVGKTSRARKGTSRANMRRLFAQAVPQWSEYNVVSGLSSGEGLIAAMQEEDDPLARRLLVVETEFGKVLTVAGRTGNTLSDYIRQLWEGDKVRILNKKRVTVDGAFFSLIGHITAEELRVKMSDVDIANGFANRILWVYADRSQLIPSGSGLPTDRLDYLAGRIRSAVERAQQITTMRRSAAAEDCWQTVYTQMATTSGSGLLDVVTNRAEAQTLRLSMAYAALEGCATIEPRHIQAAYALWQYCEASAVHVFGDTTGNPVADRILAALEASDDHRITRSEISSSLFNNNRKASELDLALCLLVERGRVRIERAQHTSGRPPIWIILQ